MIGVASVKLSRYGDIIAEKKSGVSRGWVVGLILCRLDGRAGLSEAAGIFVFP